MAWLRKNMRDHVASSRSVDPEKKVLKFPSALPRSESDESDAAVALVYQAAEAIRGIEDRATASEARAQGLVQDAAEKLQAAENRIRVLEVERRAAHASLNEATLKIQEAQKAVEQAALRIAVAESALSEADLRARTAETRAGDAEKALGRIELAIRTHLLGQRQAPYNQSAA